MRQTKIQKCHAKINDAFRESLDTAFRAKFQRGCKTTFSIFTMGLITDPIDGGNFTPEQYAWIEAFSDGYIKAMGMVWEDEI
jgi:hypothetical protein